MAKPAKAPDHADWRGTLDHAFKLVELATSYADDGALLTAADRLTAAADQFRAAHAARLAASHTPA